MFFHFSLLIHVIVQQHLPFFHHNVCINDFARLLIALHFLRQKFRLHLCYSLIVPRKRWKDVFWDAMRFHFLTYVLMFSLCILVKTTLFLFPTICFILQGRVDDNIETIRKRFKVFVESSLPVIEYYDAKDKVKKVRLQFHND
ncbi:UMP-CMP kinase 4 [Hordeum vulgare]|nr:UMP-CMP kinase 4 [Hordeum vulgare]